MCIEAIFKYTSQNVAKLIANNTSTSDWSQKTAKIKAESDEMLTVLDSSLTCLWILQSNCDEKCALDFVHIRIVLAKLVTYKLC